MNRDIIMRVFYSVFCCVIILLIVITINIRQESTNFYGIAETKEMVINAEFGVEIKNMRITPGQTVYAGDTLVELRSPEIDLKVSEFTHLINEMNTRSKTQANLSKAELKQLKTENESRFIEILSEMQELQAQFEINRKLVQNLRSIRIDGSKEEINDSNPTLIRIENLKKELSRIEKSNFILEDNLHSQISFGVDPLQEMLKQYQDQLRLYKELKEKMFIIAPNNGVIGAVYYKKGEMVSAFDSIATLHSKSPSFIVGYIHENIYSSVVLGQKVNVRSIADKSNVVEGEIIGVGTRIVEYPLRLRNVQELLMWGREVTVKINPDNNFLLGEKVIISIADKPGTVKKIINKSKSLQAATLEKVSAPLVTKPTIKNISWTPNTESDQIEASGILYLSDINKYCVISDESPALYLMDSNGVVSNQVFIDSLNKIDDMEGITSDEKGNIYIVCSQNPTKKGKLPDKRKYLIRLSRNSEKIQLTGKILLIDALTEAAKSAGTEKWTELVKIDTLKRTPDIEGITCKDNSIFISFKEPLIGENSAIIKIDNADSIFIKNSINPSNVKLWKLLPLKDRSTGITYQISDIQFINDDLYILSVGSFLQKGKSLPFGRLWILHSNEDRLDVVQNFSGLKPEGITFNKEMLIITFDNGSDQMSQFTTLKRFK